MVRGDPQLWHFNDKQGRLKGWCLFAVGTTGSEIDSVHCGDIKDIYTITMWDMYQEYLEGGLEIGEIGSVCRGEEDTRKEEGRGRKGGMYPLI